jgi:hypothetical protein
MATRSTTHFRRSSGDPSAIVYRHWDGYPEGHGADLLRFFAEVGELSDSRFGDPQYLAAKLVVFLAREFAVDYTWPPGAPPDGVETPRSSPLDFLGVGICLQDPGDIEYRYLVNCYSPIGLGLARPFVMVQSTSGGYDRPMSYHDIGELGSVLKEVKL